MVRCSHILSGELPIGLMTPRPVMTIRRRGRPVELKEGWPVELMEDWRGGENGWTNVVTACSKCNLRKADRLPHECGLPLLTEPREPNHVELIWAVRSVTPVQAKYIGTFYGQDVVRALS